MDAEVNKKVPGKPIEKLLKNNLFLNVDKSYLAQSLERLQALRETYMLSPSGSQPAFMLPERKV